MKMKLRGSLTIELAYLFPLVLLVFGVLLHVLFYYHDKNILLGAAHETAAYGAGLEEVQEEELEAYFDTRLKERLLLFEQLEKKVGLQKETITVTCNAKKSMMSLGIECSVNRTEPEDYIRSVRKLIKIGEGKGEKE